MSVFDQFTNLYSLSKTLRFELKPEGKTLKNMREHLRWDEKLQTFFADQEVEDAYQTLKPIFDKLHEEFINDSLNSEQVKNIDFSEYLSEYLIEYKAKKVCNFSSHRRCSRIFFNVFPSGFSSNRRVLERE